MNEVFLHMVASNCGIKEDELQSSSTTMSKETSSGKKKTKTWIDMINQSVHTADDTDIGDLML